MTTWDTYNEFLLRGGVDRVAKLLARYELYRQVVNLPGDIVEGGVFKGAGLLYWAKLVQIFNPLSPRKVIGFDTFAGYPSDLSRTHDRETGKRFEAEADYRPVSPEEIRAVAVAVGLESRIELVPGKATVTIENYVRDNPGFRVALLNLDFDTFDATEAALKHFYPLVVPGGLVVLDDYGTRGWGESDAVDAYFRGLDVRIESLPWTMSPTAFVRKRGAGG